MPKISKDNVNLQKTGRVVEYAFNKTYDVTKDANFLSRFENADVYGDFVDETIASAIMVNKYPLMVYGKKLSMGGVGYVASLPEYRGNGGISRLMKELLADLHGQGTAVSNLAPFSERFYRHFGYENTISQKKYDITPAAFSNLIREKGGSITRGTFADEKISAEVISLHDAVLKENERNTIIREKWWWNRLDSYYSNRNIAVCHEDGKATGYLIYRISGLDFIMDEFVHETPVSFRRLLNFAGSHNGQCASFSYAAPVHENIEEAFTEHEGITVTLVPYMMSRIIDVKKLLDCMPIAENIVLGIQEDALCPWNVGNWVRDSAEGWHKTDSEPDISGPITSFAQLLLGEPPLESLISSGKLSGKRIDGFEKLNGKVSFYDYF